MNEPDFSTIASDDSEGVETAGRRVWERPELIDLGSVAEMTESSGGLGEDGGLANS